MVKDAGIVLRKYKRKKMFYPQKAERLSKVIVFQPENLRMILWNFFGSKRTRKKMIEPYDKRSWEKLGKDIGHFNGKEIFLRLFKNMSLHL